MKSAKVEATQRRLENILRTAEARRHSLGLSRFDEHSDDKLLMLDMIADLAATVMWLLPSESEAK